MKHFEKNNPPILLFSIYNLSSMIDKIMLDTGVGQNNVNICVLTCLICVLTRKIHKKIFDNMFGNNFFCNEYA